MPTTLADYDQTKSYSAENLTIAKPGCSLKQEPLRFGRNSWRGQLAPHFSLDNTFKVHFESKREGVYRLHTAILNRPLSNAATKEV